MLNRAIRWLALLCLAMTVATVAAAQDRMPKIPLDKLTDAQQKAIAQRRAEQQPRMEACNDPKMDAAKCTPEFFDLHGPMVPLLRSPEVMLAANAMTNYLEFKTALPPEIRELVILLAAREWSQQYVWNSHYKTSINDGLSPAKATAISEGRRPSDMSDEEEAAYNFCDELHKTHGVSDSTYARTASKFGEQGVIDIVSTDGFYSYLSMVMNVARTPLPKTASAPPLAALPR
jgi:4-carboxymuconolactone decarboxylase